VNLPVRLRPAARDEYDEAVDWFESRRPGDGGKFIDAIQATFDRLAANPRMHGVVRGDVRRAIVGRYKYYCVYYRVRSDHVEVLSVFHASRDPGDWQSRI